LETNSFTWTAGDSIEQIITPYYDSRGWIQNVATYTPGGAARDWTDAYNTGARTWNTGLSIGSRMQIGGGADTLAWLTGISISGAATGLALNTTTGILQTNPAGAICWTSLSGNCISPDAAIGGGMMLTMTNGSPTTTGNEGSLWAYARHSSNSLNPLNNTIATEEFGGNFLVRPNNVQTTTATAATIGFDPTTGFQGPWTGFVTTDGDGVFDHNTYPRLEFLSQQGMMFYGDTGSGLSQTLPGAPIATATFVQGGSEAELGIENNALTNQVTFLASAPGVVQLGGNETGGGGGVQPKPTTIANLLANMACGSALYGTLAQISNGVASPTPYAVVSTTGSTHWTVICNENGWVYQ
jgi:hypothetical protein